MASKDSSPSTDELGTPRFAAANVDKINVSEVVQLVSEVPTGTKVTTVAAQMKPTLKSRRRVLNRGTVFAMNWFNTPLKDGEMYVASAYQIIKTMAANYQRTHQDGFFEAWPGCLIKEKSEEIPATNEIRAKYEDYSERLAHYAWHYYNAKCMLTGALANLLILSRLNGNTLMKDIAADCKWSRVNTYTNMYSRFPTPIGLDDFIASNSAYAIGKTSYGADILSIPQWIVDIYGNRGCHALTPDSMITNRGGLGQDFVSSNLDNPSGDGLFANILLENVFNAISEYGANPSNTDGNNYYPRMPRVENGTTLTVQDSTGDVTVALNSDSFWMGKDSNDPKVARNQISATAWKNYMYWQDYMIRNFPEMLDPNSDIYVFFTTQLKLVEPAKTPKAMLDIIHSLKNIDMVDLRESMKYKRNNAATTNTILKWMPLCGGSLGRNCSRENLADAEQCFDENFHRYKTHGLGTAAMIHENSKWPRLTPTSFTKCVDGNDNIDDDKAFVPFVFNAGPSVGIEMLNSDPTNTSDGVNESAIQFPVGKFAYLLDLACTRLSDPEHGHVSGYGITEGAMKEFIDNANGIVFDEDPSNVRIFTQPLIDVTDPFQCGFNIILSNTILTPNEWRWYLDPESYADGANPEAAIRDFGSGNKVTTEPAIADTTSSTGASIMHITNPKYMDLIKYAIMFVGDGIFDQPYQNLSSNLAALPIYEIQMGTYKDATVKRFADKWTEPAVATNPANGYEAIELSILGAGVTEHINDEIKPASGVVMDMLRTYDKTTNNLDVVLSLFNPAYGPIKIVAHCADDYAGKVPNSIWNQTLSGPTQINLKPTLVDVTHLDKLAAGFANLKRQVLWDAVKYAVHYWIEFLSEYQFNPAAYDTGYAMYITPREQPFEPIMVTDPGHTFRTFLSSINAQFCGCDKFNPFWSSDNLSESRMKTLPPKLTTTFAMPENYVQAEPRVARSTTSPAKNYNDVKAKTTGWKTKVDESEKAMGGSHKQCGNKSRHGKRPCKDNKKGRNEINADGIISDTGIGIKEGSTFDDSTLKEEKISKEFTKAGKKMTGANTELA